MPGITVCEIWHSTYNIIFHSITQHSTWFLTHWKVILVDDDNFYDDWIVTKVKEQQNMRFCRCVRSEAVLSTSSVNQERRWTVKHSIMLCVFKVILDEDDFIWWLKPHINDQVPILNSDACYVISIMAQLSSDEQTNAVYGLLLWLSCPTKMIEEVNWLVLWV